MTAADLLRRAAKLMRERAEAATPGPRMVYDPNEGSGHGPLYSIANDEYHNPHPTDDWLALNVYVECGVKADAEHIASWDPAVALAVAGWLDTEANMHGVRGNSSEGQTFHALAVARAYLGES